MIMNILDVIDPGSSISSADSGNFGPSVLGIIITSIIAVFIIGIIVSAIIVSKNKKK